MTLTPRQRDVVALLHAGLTCPEIATRLQIAERTVRRHVEDIDALLRKEHPSDAPPLKLIRKHAPELLEAA